MKELLIEKKAKAYDNLIERLKDFQFEYRFSVFSDTIERYFPELNESDDEKTRKELIEQVAYIVPNDDEVDSEGNVLPTYQKRIDKYRAWLEKQVEQKPIEWSEDDKKHFDNIIQELKNQCDRPINASYKEIIVSDIDWLKSIKDRVQSKQRWSEEDSRICKAIIDNIQAICEEGYFVGNISSDKLVEWLKFLKDRVQSKKEWSEEDKKMFVNIKACLRNANKDYSAELDWLKSLKPQKQWKPSKEQLYYLSWIANIKLGDSVVEQEVSKHLNELYEQLKQL